MVSREAAARAIEDFLRALGHEPEGDLEGTGERVADAWVDDLLEGEAIDAAALLREGAIATSTASAHPIAHANAGLVVLRDLAVATMCPHHLLPAHGLCTLAYLPGDKIAGLGTLAHVVDALSRRLTLQEHIGDNVVRLLVTELGARGALCRLTLTHTCLIARGERKTSALVETLAVAGTFAHPGPDRDLALAALSARPASSG
ncbi:MAG: GTP cyclohydrolase I [Byssovorax sp.]